jgi:hypothetical protein
MSSTGPSEKSLARTRYNSVKHGMRSTAVLLPGENLLELDELRETWFNKLNPRDPAEVELVTDVVNARWHHHRSERALFRFLKADIEQAAGREEESVASDIRGLFSDARGHHGLYAISTGACGGPTTSYPTGDTTKKDPNEPSILVNRLESSEKGCLALTSYWKILRTRLEDGLEWQAHDRLKAIRMLSRQPLDVLEDQQVLLIYIGSFALHPTGRTDPLEDLKCEMSTPEVEPFLKRVRTRWPLILDASDTAKAKQTLFDLVDRNIERIEAKVEEFRRLAAEGLESWAGRPASDGSIEADRLKRYELASDRRAKRCLEAFWKLRREMEEEDGELRTEGGGRRAEDWKEDGGRGEEDGGEKRGAENPAELRPESGVVEAESSLPEKELTSEANGRLAASEANQLKEVAAANRKVEKALVELSAMPDRGTGSFGTVVGGGRKGRAAIEDMISSGGPLMRPIS